MRRSSIIGKYQTNFPLMKPILLALIIFFSGLLSLNAATKGYIVVNINPSHIETNDLANVFSKSNILNEIELDLNDQVQTSLTLTGSFTALDKEYDGNKSATIDVNNLTLVGVVDGDDVSITNVTVDFGDTSAGANKTVSIESVALGGADANKYSVNLDGSPTTQATITAKALTVSGSFTVKNKVADGNKSAMIDGNNLTLDGVVDGDDVSITNVTVEFFDASAGANKTVRITRVILSGVNSVNYTVDLVGPPPAPTTTANISVGPISVSKSTVTASPASLKAGGESIVTITLMDAFENKISGLESSDFTIVLSNDATLVPDSFVEEGGNGVYRIRVKSTKAGGVTLTVQVGQGADAVELVNKPTITFSSGPPSKVRLEFSSKLHSFNDFETIDEISRLKKDTTEVVQVLTYLVDEFGNITNPESIITFDLKLEGVDNLNFGNSEYVGCPNKLCLKEIEFSNNDTLKVNLTSVLKGLVKISLAESQAVDGISPQNQTELDILDITDSLFVAFYSNLPEPEFTLNSARGDTILSNQTIRKFSGSRLSLRLPNISNSVKVSYKIDDQNDQYTDTIGESHQTASIIFNGTDSLSININRNTSHFWNEAGPYIINFISFDQDDLTIFPATGSSNISTIAKLTAAFKESDGNKPGISRYLKSTNGYVSYNVVEEREFEDNTTYEWVVCIDSEVNIIGDCTTSYSFTSREMISSVSALVSNDFKRGNGTLGYRLLSIPFAESRGPVSFLIGQPIYDWRAFDLEYNEEDISFKPGNALWVISKNKFEIPGNYNVQRPIIETDDYELTLKKNSWQAFSLPFYSPAPPSFDDIFKHNALNQDSVTIHTWNFDTQGWIRIVNFTTPIENQKAYIVKVVNDEPNSTIDISVPYTPLVNRGIVNSVPKKNSRIQIIATFDNDIQQHINLPLSGYTFDYPFPDRSKNVMAIKNENSEILYSDIPLYNLYPSSTLYVKSEYNTASFHISSDLDNDFVALLQNINSDFRYVISSMDSTTIPLNRGENFFSFKLLSSDEFELLEVQDIPERIELNQNYPNPFNPSTIIRYGLPTSNNVTLELYDILGKKIMTLINSQQEAGWHQVTFNGVSLSSGVYFYRLQTDNEVIVRKMTLIK